MNETWLQYLPTTLRDKVADRRALHTIISSTAWLFADNILKMVVGLLVGIWVTRYLGPEKLGLLSYAIALVTLFSSIAMLGLDGIVVRNIVTTPDRRDEILGSAFALKLASGLTATVLVLAATMALRPADNQTLLLVAITAIGLILQPFSTIDLWFQSQVKSKFSVWVRITTCLLIAVAKIPLVIYHAPLTAFAWAGAADVLLGSIGLVLAYRHSALRITAWRCSMPMVRELFRDGVPLMLTDIVIYAYLRIDKIILGEISGDTELGIYAIAAMLAEAFYFIPMAIATALFPAVVAARESGEDIFHDRLQKYYNLMALLGYAVAVPVTLLACWLIPLMYGQAFAKAGPMLIGLTWAGLFYNLTIVRGQYLTAINWTRLHFVMDFLGCVANVSLNVILIPNFGGMGAVIATLISYWLTTHGLCFFYKPLRRSGMMMTRAMLYPKIW